MTFSKTVSSGLIQSVNKSAKLIILYIQELLSFLLLYLIVSYQVPVIIHVFV